MTDAMPGAARRPALRRRLAACAALPLFGASPAHALEYQIYSPLVVKGENEVEGRGFFSSGNPRLDEPRQGYRVSVGRGLTENWAMEVYAVGTAAGGAPLQWSQVEWENRFQLAPQGKYWLDTGLMAEVEFATRSASPSEYALTAMLEKQLGRVLITLNPYLERQFGSNAATGTVFGYRGRVEYRLPARIAPALEFHGEAGRIGHLGPVPLQRHQVGPAFYGATYLNRGRTLRYSAAVLFGVTGAAADATLVTRLEYEFY